MCFVFIAKPQLPCLLVVCLENGLQIFSIFMSNVKMCQKYQKLLYSCWIRLLKWEIDSFVFEACSVDNIFSASHKQFMFVVLLKIMSTQHGSEMSFSTDVQ